MKSPSFDLVTRVTVVTCEDIRERTFISIVRTDYPALAEKGGQLFFPGVALVAAPDEVTLKEAMSSIEADIEPLKPCLP